MSIIINDLVEEYIDLFYESQSELLYNLRKQAEEENVPIITKDTEKLMHVLLAMNQPKRILEIGTAIGYSAISFASFLEHVEIVSLELRDIMYERALINIKQSGLSPKIQVIKGDAKEVLPSIEGPFDMVFIDAAKGHYKVFFDSVQSLLSNQAVIVSDNVLYKGMTASNKLLIKRKRTIAKRMREYLKYISNHTKYDTAILPVGDGISISVRKVEKK